MTTLREAAQMALDALEHGLPIIEDFGGKEQLQLQHKAIAVLYEALRAALAQLKQEPVWGDSQVTKPEIVAEQKAMNEGLRKMVEQKPVAWRSAAMRIGEELSSVGPDWYYEMTAEQWLDWALAQNPKGKTSLPQREWQGLTDEEIMKITGVTSADSDWNVTIVHKWIRAIEAKLREKNA